ncbi:hypothetical protein DFH09DRAFT_1086596 [Mycena vulgaris]|nr:hypothetical protein DFH09DRAFT_1086596 [Mycena vulgaris]
MDSFGIVIYGLTALVTGRDARGFGVASTGILESEHGACGFEKRWIRTASASIWDVDLRARGELWTQDYGDSSMRRVELMRAHTSTSGGAPGPGSAAVARGRADGGGRMADGGDSGRRDGGTTIKTKVRRGEDELCVRYQQAEEGEGEEGREGEGKRTRTDDEDRKERGAGGSEAARCERRGRERCEREEGRARGYKKGTYAWIRRWRRWRTWAGWARAGGKREGKEGTTDEQGLGDGAIAGRLRARRFEKDWDSDSSFRARRGEKGCWDSDEFAHAGIRAASLRARDSSLGFDSRCGPIFASAGDGLECPGFEPAFIGERVHLRDAEIRDVDCEHGECDSDLRSIVGASEDSRCGGRGARAQAFEFGVEAGTTGVDLDWCRFANVESRMQGLGLEVEVAVRDSARRRRARQRRGARGCAWVCGRGARDVDLHLRLRARGFATVPDFPLDCDDSRNTETACAHQRSGKWRRGELEDVEGRGRVCGARRGKYGNGYEEETCAWIPRRGENEGSGWLRRATGTREGAMVWTMDSKADDAARVQPGWSASSKDAEPKVDSIEMSRWWWNQRVGGTMVTSLMRRHTTGSTATPYTYPPDLLPGPHAPRRQNGNVQPWFNLGA